MKESLKKVYKKEYFIYMGILFLPLIWKITQICFLNSFENSMKILGQISLMAIIFKCFQETILNPLYKIFNDEKTNQDLKQKIQIKFLFFYSIATIIFTLIVFLFINKIMIISKVPTYIFDETKTFLKYYVLACGLKIISEYLFTINLINNNTRNLFVYLLITAFLTLFFNLIFIPKWMLGFGTIGVALTDILVNVIIIIYLIIKMPKSKVEKLKFDIKKYAKLAILSLLETLIRNLAYYFVILVFLNMINNQDLYFIANDFIWSIMLIPVLAQNNLIKQELSKDISSDLKPYFLNQIIINSFILLMIPIAYLVFRYVYNFENYYQYFATLLKLLPCYILFNLDAVAESYFITIGKLNYVLFQTIISNIFVYLIAYILYLCNVWIVSLNSIILLFNIGVILSSCYTLATYIIYRKKTKSA